MVVGAADGMGYRRVVGADNLPAGTSLDLQYGYFSNATAIANVSHGLRVTTTVYAHRAERSLLVFEVAADFGSDISKQV